MSLSFARDIKPLFRASDRDEMDWAFDLWSHDDVSASADRILERLSEGLMPCDEPWPVEDVEKFRQWVAHETPA
jgi:hypothetical protein